jgi:hypothetical protein
MSSCSPHRLTAKEAFLKTSGSVGGRETPWFERPPNPTLHMVLFFVVGIGKCWQEFLVPWDAANVLGWRTAFAAQANWLGVISIAFGHSFELEHVLPVVAEVIDIFDAIARRQAKIAEADRPFINYLVFVFRIRNAIRAACHGELVQVIVLPVHDDLNSAMQACQCEVNGRGASPKARSTRPLCGQDSAGLEVTESEASVRTDVLRSNSAEHAKHLSEDRLALMRGAQMRVTLHHQRASMSHQRLQCVEIDATHCGAGRKSMAEIVKMKVPDFCA